MADPELPLIAFSRSYFGGSGVIFAPMSAASPRVALLTNYPTFCQQFMWGHAAASFGGGDMIGFAHVRECILATLTSHSAESGAASDAFRCLRYGKQGIGGASVSLSDCEGGAVPARLPLPRELRLSFHLFKYMNLPAIGCAILQIYTKRHGKPNQRV